MNRGKEEGIDRGGRTRSKDWLGNEKHSKGKNKSKKEKDERNERQRNTRNKKHDRHRWVAWCDGKMKRKGLDSSDRYKALGVKRTGVRKEGGDGQGSIQYTKPEIIYLRKSLAMK